MPSVAVWPEPHPPGRRPGRRSVGLLSSLVLCGPLELALACHSPSPGTVLHCHPRTSHAPCELGSRCPPCQRWRAGGAPRSRNPRCGPDSCAGAWAGDGRVPAPRGEVTDGGSQEPPPLGGLRAPKTVVTPAQASLTAHDTAGEAGRTPTPLSKATRVCLRTTPDVDDGHRESRAPAGLRGAGFPGLDSWAAAWPHLPVSTPG